MKFIVPLLAALVLGGCNSGASPMPYAIEYRDALQRSPGAPQDAASVAARFVDMFADIHDPALPDKVRALYAPELYFNDTLATFRDRAALIRYLSATADRVQVMDVEMLDAFAVGNDIYLRWFMHLEFKAGWRQAATDTVGITHLRLDSSGKVILHQDFWDNAEGIFRQVPIVGRAVAMESS